MRQLKLALLISAITTFAAACASTNTTVSNGNSNNPNTNSTAAANTAATPALAASDELASARATYTAVCARCHQESGEGGTVEFDEGGTLKVPSFKSGHGLTHTEAQFARQIAKGGEGMPAFEKKLTPEQINGLVRYIRQEIQAGLLKDGAHNPSH
ncbi:MAG TPA: cytochrome c [Pyrinomonadaceae bacterium]|jgi:mono/diheme cytochrome c family protein|nr:cytochrome c [Pyrinomonadaceae bacterium]